MVGGIDVLGKGYYLKDNVLIQWDQDKETSGTDFVCIYKVIFFCWKLTIHPN